MFDDCNTISTILDAEFKRLCAEFNVDTENCHFGLATERVIYLALYKRVWAFKNIITAQDLMYNIVNADYGADESIFINYVFAVMENGKLDQWAFLTVANLWELLYKQKCVGATDEEAIEYLKQSLRHEVGHMIANQKIFDENGIEEGSKIFKDLKKKQDRAWKRYITRKGFDLDSLDEEGIRAYYVKYHNLPFEKAANEAVGLTAKEMAEAEVVFWKRRRNLDGTQ